MNDKELLERAARAAGYDEFGMHWDKKGGFRFLKGPVWNPLVFPDDLIHLMSDLRIDIVYFDDSVRAVVPGREEWKSEDFGLACRYKAVRRAVVRAAASLAHPPSAC